MNKQTEQLDKLIEPILVKVYDMGQSGSDEWVVRRETLMWAKEEARKVLDVAMMIGKDKGFEAGLEQGKREGKRELWDIFYDDVCNMAERFPTARQLTDFVNKWQALKEE